MDAQKTGALIRRLRLEKGLTQKELAEKLQISDKAVSKWERGLGCPDVGLLTALAEALEVTLPELLAGERPRRPADGGNMKRIKFYRCPDCGSIFTATGAGELSCCGRPLAPLALHPAEGEHLPQVEVIDGERYITLNHEMSKEHYLAFAAYVSWDRVLLVRLYPEQDAAVRLPIMPRGTLYLGCSRHGLMQYKL